MNDSEGTSNLRRGFERRQAAMERGNDPYEGARPFERIDSYIDSNFNDIDEYAQYHDEDDVAAGNRQAAASPVDHVSFHRRTTSIHRNIGRFGSGNVEERRQWTSCAATLCRQPLDEHAEKIVSHMQHDSALIEDSPEGEQLRREALKDMPQCLAVKKRVKRRFVSSITNTKNIGMFQMLKYQIAMSWTHLKMKVRNLAYTFELWYSSLKRIEGNFGSGVASYFKFLRWLFVINITMTVFCFSFISIPQIVVGDSVNNRTELRATNFLAGNGYLDDTLLYYGFYANKTVGNGYRMPEAYFFTMTVMYIVVFVVLSVSMAKSYRKSFIETQGGLQNVFAHKIFCGWDYSIATTKAASLKSKSIYNELKELVSDIYRPKTVLSFCNKLRVVLMQVAAHLFALAVGLASGYLMYVLLTNYNDKLILRSVIINIVMIVVPMIFRLFASYEDYKNPKVTLFVTLARTVFMEMAVIAVLIYYWLNEAAKEGSEEEVIDCWENKLGQEIYRLILFDFFFSTLLMTLVDVTWYVIHKNSRSVDPPEFDIATNTLSLIYNQTLFWVGCYFSPLLGVMVALKLFLTWYVRSFILLQCCNAPKKTWRAAQTESWFLIIVFLWSLVLLFVHGYHIFGISSSTNCGPLTEDITGILTVSTDRTVVNIVAFLLKPGVIAIVLVGMAMGVYYLRAVANAQIDMVYFLRHRLVLAAKDKEFLLENINDLIKEEFKYKRSDKREDLIDPTKLAPNIVEVNRSGIVGPDVSVEDVSVNDIFEQHSEENPRIRY